jgi:hypothetical protein
LRILVSISAIGSVIPMVFSAAYQLALISPGICPLRALSRRHNRHMRKRR